MVFRISIRRLNGGFPGMPGGGLGNLMQTISQRQQQRDEGGGAAGSTGGGFSPPNRFNPQAMAQFKDAIAKSMTPDLQAQMQQRMSQMMQGGMGDGAGGGKIGIMMMGVGENERGKKVARAAKMEIDPKTGKISKDFVEKQLDPDDVMLPKSATQNYDSSDATEIEIPSELLEEQEGGASRSHGSQATHHRQHASSSASSRRVIHQEETLVEEQTTRRAPTPAPEEIEIVIESNDQPVNARR